jgi:hypothetical protein
MAQKFTRDILKSLALDVGAFEIMAFSIYQKYNTELFEFIAHALTEKIYPSSPDRWLERLFHLAEGIVASRDQQVVLLSRDLDGSSLVFALPVLLFMNETPTHIILAVASCENVEDAKERRDQIARLIRMV